MYKKKKQVSLKITTERKIYIFMEALKAWMELQSERLDVEDHSYMH